ncbi:MAG: tetratricopeptide repeat protein [Pyrinomonadaceae bacterium]
MKILAITAAAGALLLPIAAASQTRPTSTPRPRTNAASPPAKKRPVPPTKTTRAASAEDDAAALQKASEIANADEKIAALQIFLLDRPGSERIAEAREILATTAAAAGDEKLAAGSLADAATYYKIAIEALADTVPDKLFTESLGKAPNILFWRGYRAEALQIAAQLESKIAANASQLAALATFYLGIENGEAGLRLAEKAVALDPASPSAYQTFGMARRLNFQLDDAAAAFQKAVELDPASRTYKRSLAEMKRALGRADEAAEIFRELVAADASDNQSRTGLVLSLFDAGRRADAETEMAAYLEQNPNNLILLAGAAYWYAAHGAGDKGEELARRAIALEPRYIWSHIALGRSLMAQNRPVDAEEELLRARRYGRFPTLDYEIAAARFRAGFFREAAEELQKSFAVNDAGQVVTKLGGRVERAAPDFIELLSGERRASTLEPAAADDAETAARMKALLAFHSRIGVKEPSVETIAAAADAFVAGDDAMKVHRQLYAASTLLDKKVAADKALELARAAIGSTDPALELPNAAAAVMASELYDARALAESRDEFLRVPDVPKQTLSAILRGRVEELAGWALLQRNDAAEAVVRLRRAVSVLPPKSAWWRSSMWRLGAALEASGSEKEALESYIKSYSIDKPDAGRYFVIESLYKRLKGSTQGLEALVGRDPLSPAATQTLAQQPSPAPAAAAPRTATDAPPPTFRMPSALPVARPAGEPESNAAPAVAATPQPSPEPAPTPTPTVEPLQPPKTDPETLPSPSPAGTPVPDAAPSPAASPATESSPVPSPEPSVSPEPSASPTPSETPAAPTPTPEPPAEPAATPAPQVEPSPAAEAPSPTPTPEERAALPAADASPTVKTRAPADKAAAAPRVVVTDNLAGSKTARQEAQTAAVAKQLFEPIVITVPGSASAQKRDEPDTRPAPDAEPAARLEIVDRLAAGEARPRVIRGKDVQQAGMPPCRITVSDARLRLVANGGSLGVLVGVEGGELDSVTAAAVSPDDIAVTREPEIEGIKGRLLFMVKSISERSGLYSVRFEAPCGKREISVDVR